MNIVSLTKLFQIFQPFNFSSSLFLIKVGQEAIAILGVESEEFPHFERQITKAYNYYISEINFLIDDDSVEVKVKHAPYEEQYQRGEKNKCKLPDLPEVIKYK